MTLAWLLGLALACEPGEPVLAVFAKTGKFLPATVVERNADASVTVEWDWNPFYCQIQEIEQAECRVAEANLRRSDRGDCSAPAVPTPAPTQPPRPSATSPAYNTYAPPAPTPPVPPPEEGPTVWPVIFVPALLLIAWRVRRKRLVLDVVEEKPAPRVATPAVAPEDLDPHIRIQAEELLEYGTAHADAIAAEAALAAGSERWVPDARPPRGHRWPPKPPRTPPKSQAWSPMTSTQRTRDGLRLHERAPSWKVRASSNLQDSPSTREARWMLLGRRPTWQDAKPGVYSGDLEVVRREAAAADAWLRTVSSEALGKVENLRLYSDGMGALVGQLRSPEASKRFAPRAKDPGTPPGTPGPPEPDTVPEPASPVTPQRRKGGFGGATERLAAQIRKGFERPPAPAPPSPPPSPRPLRRPPSATPEALDALARALRDQAGDKGPPPPPPRAKSEPRLAPPPPIFAPPPPRSPGAPNPGSWLGERAGGTQWTGGVERLVRQLDTQILVPRPLPPQPPQPPKPQPGVAVRGDVPFRPLYAPTGAVQGFVERLQRGTR